MFENIATVHGIGSIVFFSGVLYLALQLVNEFIGPRKRYPYSGPGSIVRESLKRLGFALIGLVLIAIGILLNTL